MFKISAGKFNTNPLPKTRGLQECNGEKITSKNARRFSFVKLMALLKRRFFFRNKTERSYSTEVFDSCKSSTRSSVDEQGSPKTAEIDVTSVIQERPGLFPYPYQLQPGNIQVVSLDFFKIQMNNVRNSVAVMYVFIAGACHGKDNTPSIKEVFEITFPPARPVNPFLLRCKKL